MFLRIRVYQAPNQPFELDDKLILATVFQALRGFLGAMGSARCQPVAVLRVDAAAGTFVLHVRSEHVAPFLGALTLCTRTATGKPCSFATMQMSSTLASLANPRHLPLDQFPVLADEKSEEEDEAAEDGSGMAGDAGADTARRLLPS